MRDVIKFSAFVAAVMFAVVVGPALDWFTAGRRKRREPSL
jgi:hypothetical protein